MADVTVEGVVHQLHKTGTGFVLREQWRSKNFTGERRWAVWPSEAGSLAEGDRVTVRGSLRAKLSEPRATDGRQFVDLSVSDAVVERGTAPVEEPPADVWPIVEPGGWDSSVPAF